MLGMCVLQLASAILFFLYFGIILQRIFMRMPSPFPHQVIFTLCLLKILFSPTLELEVNKYAFKTVPQCHMLTSKFM